MDDLGLIIALATSMKALEHLHIVEVEQRAADAIRMRRLQELNVDLASHEIRNPLSAMFQNAEVCFCSKHVSLY